MNENQRLIVGYRIDYRKGPCYSTPAEYAQTCASGYDGGDVWGLFAEPQPGCSQEIEVYKGWCWVRPEYVSAVASLSGFTPLYLGPQIQKAMLSEDLALIFPSLIENPLREARPNLFRAPPTKGQE